MDAPTELLARAIGARVKHERQARQWTLDQLAANANLSRRMLVNVEQGTTNPSVGTLLRLSDALGVGLPALVEPPRSKPARLTRKGEGVALWNGENGGTGLLLGGTRSPNVVELWDWTLNPGEEHHIDPHTAGTEELLQVITGVLTVQVGAETYELNASDALCFSGDIFHSYANTAAAPTRFSLAVYEPGVGEDS
ncbi:XRE family transcriptional regulator [Glutamicibacter sp.]|uniref:helix-turn-helix domain-containing protein n=1 Tax=Glutamicibacter sp. TaxID=1931995 RepID=UPI0028BEBB15|nr:XRE family transcriptional regulator [Glutamicibacter sp.]